MTLKYQTLQSACFDIESASSDFILNPGERVSVATGIFVRDILPEGKYIHRENHLPVIEVLSRSGLTFKTGVVVLNAPGQVDVDYPEEIRVLLINLGERPAFIRQGDRIAQGRVILTYRPPHIDVADVVRTSGFGSTDS